MGTDDFATDANFFDLGGDSANVTLAAARLSESLGTPVSTTSIFATGTPAALARLLAAEGTVRISEPKTAQAQRPPSRRSRTPRGSRTARPPPPRR
ncbi:acyl carrier protein [Actinomadura keratinilytica]